VSAQFRVVILHAPESNGTQRWCALLHSFKHSRDFYALSARRGLHDGLRGARQEEDHLPLAVPRAKLSASGGHRAVRAVPDEQRTLKDKGKCLEASESSREYTFVGPKKILHFLQSSTVTVLMWSKRYMLAPSQLRMRNCSPGSGSEKVKQPFVIRRTCDLAGLPPGHVALLQVLQDVPRRIRGRAGLPVVPRVLLLAHLGRLQGLLISPSASSPARMKRAHLSLQSTIFP